MPQKQKIVLEGGMGEIVEKKSRFIASVFPVHDEEEALSIIEGMKKKYWDARHNCYAFVLGDNKEIQRYSDDGEPGGTAGKPMLDILLAENITDCLVIVTRYFGGTLLGTGGLVRAYQQAAREGIDNSKVAVKENGVMLEIEMDYNTVGKVQYMTGNERERVYVISCDYTDKVIMKIVISQEEADSFSKKVIESTNGKAVLRKGEQRKFAVSQNQVVFL